MTELAAMRSRSLAENITLLFGLVFLVVGILGFIPGITTNYDELSFAGNDSGAELLGIFQVSVLHNIVHALFGVAGLALGRTWEGARTFLLYGGIIYVVLFVYGLLVSQDGDANFVPVNGAGDWLHLLLAVAMLGAWWVTGRERPT
jgi:Domain of unknown function (DUF4383)